jgi:hypothetical protein
LILFLDELLIKYGKTGCKICTVSFIVILRKTYFIKVNEDYSMVLVVSEIKKGRNRSVDCLPPHTNFLDRLPVVRPLK